VRRVKRKSRKSAEEAEKDRKRQECCQVVQQETPLRGTQYKTQAAKGKGECRQRTPGSARTTQQFATVTPIRNSLRSGNVAFSRTRVNARTNEPRKGVHGNETSLLLNSKRSAGTLFSARYTLSSLLETMNGNETRLSRATRVSSQNDQTR